VILIVYDGACPFCSAYVRLLRLKEHIGQVELLNARAADARIARYQQQGFDLDQGMLVILGDVVHSGADAMHVLASCSTPSAGFNRLNAWIFASRFRCALLYPLLRVGRRIVLLILGVPLIHKNHH